MFRRIVVGDQFRGRAWRGRFRWRAPPRPHGCHRGGYGGYGYESVTAAATARTMATTAATTRTCTARATTRRPTTARGVSGLLRRLWLDHGHCHDDGGMYILDRLLADRRDLKRKRSVAGARSRRNAAVV